MKNFLMPILLWFQLQKEQNVGCGPWWIPKWLADLLFNWFFETSCEKHDAGYDIGGDEVRRFECDWKLLHAMFRDVRRLKWYWRPLALTTAIIFFVIVRTLGWAQFNYTKSGVTY